MARPRKTQNEPDAKQRINDAFWFLLQTNEIREITVSMITAHAHCNRGTFYYHYQDLDDLVASALEEELLRANLFAEGIFRMNTDEQYNIFEDLNPQLIQRMKLIVDRTGMETVFDKIRTLVLDLWTTIACADGERLAPEAQTIVSYYTSGVIGVFIADSPAIANVIGQSKTCDDAHRAQPASPVIVDFVRKNSKFVLQEICAIQGIPTEVAIERIATVNSYLRTHER